MRSKAGQARDGDRQEPAEKPDGKPVGKSVGKPVGEPEGGRVAQQVAEPAGTLEVKRVRKPVGDSVDEAVGRSLDASVDPEAGANAQLVTPMIRGWRLLRYIAEGGTTSNLSEVGRAIDVNRVTIMRLLATLEHEGLIEKRPHGGHRLGMRFLTLAATALYSDDLLGHARRIIAGLSTDLGLAAYFVISDGDDVIYVLRELPEQGLISQIRVGSRVPAYQTAPGRALLASLSRDEARNRLARRDLVHGRTGAKLELEAFVQVLEEDRRRGCAWSHSGFEAGINACAGAVIGATGEAVGALSVVGPQHIFERTPGLSEQVQAAVIQSALQLSLMAGGSPPDGSSKKASRPDS